MKFNVFSSLRGSRFLNGETGHVARGGGASPCLLILFLVLLCSAGAQAQFTTVTGTVTDPNGLPYAYGTIAPVIVSSGTPKFTATSQPYIQPVAATGLDITGSFTIRLADNTQLTPGSSTWTFTVCSAIGTVQPAFGKGPVCFKVTGVTISGSSQSITSTLTAAALALTNSAVLPGAIELATNGVDNHSQTFLNLTDGTAGGDGSGIVFVRPLNASGGFVSLNLILNGGVHGSLFYENGAGNLAPIQNASFDDSAQNVSFPRGTFSTTTAATGSSYPLNVNFANTNTGSNEWGALIALQYSGGNISGIIQGGARIDGTVSVGPSTFGTMVGLYGTASNLATATVDGLNGVEGQAGLSPLSAPTATITEQAGGYFTSQVRATSIPLNAGVYGQAKNDICATCTATIDAAVYADSPPAFTGTSTHHYGVYVADQTTSPGSHNPDPHGVYVVAGGIENKPVVFSTLPPCAAAYEGDTRAVSDSTTNTWGATITGSGGNHVSAYCDGTNWTVYGK
jgi:hypothetical protein